MKRRQWMAGAVGLGAAVLGAGWAWRGSRPPEEAAALGDALWTRHFAQPAGGELAMGSLKGRPLILNFWATWCPPCVEELPLLDRFHGEHRARGWQVIGLAVDGPTPVREFLAKMPLGFPVGLAGFEGIDLSRSLGNERGALPFSAIFDRDGQVVLRKLGVFKAEELADWGQRLA